MRAVLLLILLLALLAAIARPIVPGVLGWSLGPCDVHYYARRGVVALACVGHDMTRLLPLPVVSPWFEE